MKLIIQLTILFASFGVVEGFELKDGDLLFQDLDCGPLCDAIEEVTDGVGGAKFSHVGMVILTDSGAFVLEAISTGVVLTTIENFLSRSNDQKGNPKVIVGRVKSEYSEIIPAITKEALVYLGAEYDKVYLMNNNTYYCSELLYLCFGVASGNKDFFKIEAMTFKQPNSELFFPAWQSYYEDLGIQIPEGEPGLNPGGISRSDKIEIVHIFGLPAGYNP